MQTNKTTYNSGFITKAVLLFFTLLTITTCYGDEIEDETLSPYMELTSEKADLSLLSTDVKAVLLDGIVKATVTQVYQNQGDEAIEAVYLFPLSTRAAVHGMKMTIGERVIVATIEEKKQAQKIFQQAKTDKKLASLLEQQRPNVFETRVANILPGARVEVEIEFSELIQPENLTYEWVFPTVVGPRYAGEISKDDKWVDNPYVESGKNGFELEDHSSFKLEAVVRSSVDFKGFQCPSHDANIEYDNKREVRVLLNSEKEGAQANRDFIIRYKLAEEKIISGLLAHKGETDNFFMLNVQPPERVTLENIPDREYIFIVDVSGSMNGFPLNTTKELFKNLAKTLRETDKFNILFFAGGGNWLADYSLPATDDNIEKALKMMNSAKSGGITNLTKALENALSLGEEPDLARSFVVITDGYVNTEKKTFELIRESRNKANVFCFGIGSSVNRHLIEGIAKVGGGEPFIVTKPAYAAQEAKKFKEYISSPVLTSIEVEADGVTLEGLQPGRVNDLFANRSVTITGKWNTEKISTITVKGKTGDGQQFKQSFKLDPDEKHHNPVLEDLWARHVVRELIDFNTVVKDSDIQASITNLGLEYSIVTPYTSFVAVDETVQDIPNPAKTVMQPLALPAGMSGSSVSHAVKNGAIPEPSSMILFALTMLTVLCVRNRQ